VCPSWPKLLSRCADVQTVEGESVTYHCSYEANYDDFEHNVSNYWTVKIPNDDQEIHVDSNSNHTDYSVKIFNDCPIKNEICCKVTSSLMISNISIHQNDIIVHCIVDPNGSHNTENASAHLGESFHA